ncbi:MAG TPA: VPDSG-CTERM sorting domain-containing protein [Verrucomicrobiae bacterium]|nr:VPDSG-CTERM sorting domain-containing protein [Verrucomicrobiae bacterium]
MKLGFSKMVGVGAIMAMANWAMANSISVSLPSSLDGNYAYAFGVRLNVPSGEKITGMTISFDNVQLTSAPKGYLYVDLLNSGFNLSGTKTYKDYDKPGDYFAGKGIALGTEVFNYWFQTLSFSFTLTASQLAVLNGYVNDGIFGIGLDPDCGFKTKGKCWITCNYGPVSAPDSGTTAILLGAALCGVVVLRRKRILD